MGHPCDEDDRNVKLFLSFHVLIEMPTLPPQSLQKHRRRKKIQKLMGTHCYRSPRAYPLIQGNMDTASRVIAHLQHLFSESKA